MKKLSKDSKNLNKTEQDMKRRIDASNRVLSEIK